VAVGKTAQAKKIDGLLDKAQRELAGGRVFDAQTLAAQALEACFLELDYERMGRGVPVLAAARAQRREAALKAGVAPDPGPDLAAGGLSAGCYLVRPPRVGVDGRALREAGDLAEVPVLVVVREPTTAQGLWPIVAIGPVTIRTRVDPPKGGGTRDDLGVAPPVSWFRSAIDALTETALAQVRAEAAAAARVEHLYLRVQAHPDSDALHAALGEACAQAAREPRAAPRPRLPNFLEGEDDELG